MKWIWVFLVIGIAPARAAEAAWVRTLWRGEPAWQARQGAWVATVSERRGRLVYLGRGDEAANLLFAIRELPATLDKEDPPSWGGHRVWLGPQSAWKTGWPPPVEWEFSAAAETQARGEVLELQTARGETGLPQITRRYRWDGGELVCEARWSGGRLPLSAVHVFAVPISTCVETDLHPSAELPHGFALLPVWRRPGVRRNFSLPVDDVAVDGAVARIQFRKGRQKIGMSAAPIRCSSAKGRLTLLRGRELEGTLPEEGLVTQIYVGLPEEPYIEIEALSALARSGSFAVRLRPEAP